MSDSVDSSSFDIEAQQSLLGGTGAVGLPETTISVSAIILLVRSTLLFKSGANTNGRHAAAEFSRSNSSSTSATSYAAIPISDHIPTPGSEGLSSALEISADPTHVDVLISAHHSSTEQEKYDEHSIALQRVQKKNITEIVKNKNLHELLNFGGVRGVADALNTDLEKGLIPNPKKPCSQCNPSQLSQLILTFFHSFLAACNNYTIFLLLVAASFSLGFGIKEEGLRMGWFNGALIILTIFILVISTSVHRCWQERSRKNMENTFWPSSKGREIKVQVVRGGEPQSVKEIDLEVGDVAILRKGDRVLADGLFVNGLEPLELDEGSKINESNPFLFYGARVINGDARMLVTSTRMDTMWGETMSQGSTSFDKKCEFESYIHNLNTCIHIVGLLISILIIIVLFLRYKAGKLDDERRYRPESKGEPTSVKTIVDVMKGIISGSRPTARVLTTLLSVSLLGVMEGMPLVISVATIIWSRKILAHKATERDYLACIKMASITTVICTDKFGGLTEHDCMEIEIDRFYVGQETISESSVVASNVLEGLCDGIGTLLLTREDDDCPSELGHIVSWAEAKLGMRRESVIEQCKLISHSGQHVGPGQQERCQVVMEKCSSNGRYLHCKGPAADILSLCSHQYDVEGVIQEIDETKRRMLEQTIEGMKAEEKAEAIAFACKRVTADFEDASLESKDLILLALVSTKETRTGETKQAISCLMERGIKTILASGNDVLILKTIGQNCGLFTHDQDDDLALTAEEFRAWTDEQKMEKVDKICIMGNCLPSDKILLTELLRKKGKVVALVAQRTTDAPALQQADIGLTFGSWSSEVARECCDIAISGGCCCFTFLQHVVENGIHFQENIRKFIQLQLIVTISSSLINFTAAVFLGDAPITAVQLFWLNLVVALAGLAFMLTGPPSTEAPQIESSSSSSPSPSPSPSLPSPSSSSSSGELMTKAMWRNIAIQASYQITMFVTLQHKGQALLGTSGGRVKSIIYNGFFLCQMFNKFIARELERRNFLSGLFHSNNRWFWVALVLFFMCQIVFAVAEQVIGSSPGLSLKLWGLCLLIGVFSWVLDWIGKSASHLIARLVAFWKSNL